MGSEKKYLCHCPQCGIEKHSRKRDIGKICKQCNMKNIEAAYRHKKTKPDEEKFNHRAYMLINKYDLTLTEYDELLSAQECKCAICGTHVTEAVLGRSHHLHVDHNHNTGEVRGLLCWECNSGLGKFKDDVSVLLKAVEYLTERGSYAKPST